MSMITRCHRLVGAGIALGLTAATLSLAPGAPGTVAADAATGGGSIVFVKDNNVWISDGNGGAQRQITNGGTAGDPWQSPTESDNGVVVAHHGGLIYRMNQRGEVFNVIDPPALPDSLGNRLEGRDLTETAISPDGSKIAYTYFKFALGEKRWVTAFTAATQLSDFNQWGLAFYDKPAWVTGSRVVLNHWYRNKIHLYDLNKQDIPWFEEGFYTPDRKELSDMEVSRDGRWVTGVRGDVGDQSIIVIHTGDDVRTTTTPWVPDRGSEGRGELCEIGPEDNTLREPTFAPDSAAVAWTEPDGIWRSSDLNCNASTQMNRIIAGGSDPSWSQATIGQTPSVPKKHLVLKKKARVVGTAKVGKVLAVNRGSWSPAPQRFQVRWLRDGKPIARATKLRYRLTKRDRGHRISVKVNALRSGSLTTTTKTATVRVKR